MSSLTWIRGFNGTIEPHRAALDSTSVCVGRS